MDYYGLLFLYYLKGLSGKSILRLFFNIEVGGTEQLLPENTSTPTTTPILADIQYPDGLRTDQYFTYRETPTTVSNKARIKTIKGNTLVWNQLIQNGNFADTSKWTKGNGASSLAISNNEAVITIGREWNNDIRQNQGISIIRGHKYFASFEAKATVPITVALSTINASPDTVFATLTNLQTTFKKITSIATARSNADSFRMVLTENGSSYVGEKFTVRNVQIIDLTAMGLDITDPSEFTSLFSLSYYDYNLATLLSFSGTGLKISGKNLSNVSSGNNVVIAKVRKGISYVFSMKADGNVGINLKANNDRGNVLVSTSSYSSPLTFTPQEDCDVFVNGFSNVSGKRFVELTGEFQIEFGSVASDFEPYTESTLSLPISTYFPNGMKSAYNSSSLTDIVRDELSQTKAIKKVKQFTYDGSSDEDWAIEPITTGSVSGQHNFFISVAPTKKLSFAMNNMTVPYAVGTTNYINGQINAYVSNGQNLNFYPGTDITSIADFRTWLSNHPLTVNIALPIDGYEETPITTEDANEALSLLMGKSVSSSNANQLINIITKGE